MQSKVAPFAATPDSTYGRQPSSPTPEHEPAAAPGEGEETAEADVRLVIEEDLSNGAIVYKRIDRRTGRVVAQFSRENVLKMREDAGYVAGEVIRTKA